MSLAERDNAAFLFSDPIQLGLEYERSNQPPAGPLTTEDLISVITNLQEGVPAVDEFDGYIAIDSRLAVDSVRAVDVLTGNEVDRDIAEKLGRLTDPVMRLLSEDRRQYCQSLADSDPNALNALLLDAELRARGWSEEHATVPEVSDTTIYESESARSQGSLRRTVVAEAVLEAINHDARVAVGTGATRQELIKIEPATVAADQEPDATMAAVKAETEADEAVAAEVRQLAYAAKIDNEYKRWLTDHHKPNAIEKLRALSPKDLVAAGKIVLIGSGYNPKIMIAKATKAGANYLQSIQEKNGSKKSLVVAAAIGTVALAGLAAFAGSHGGHEVDSSAFDADNFVPPVGGGQTHSALDAHMGTTQPDFLLPAPKQEVIEAVQPPVRPSAIVEQYNSHTGAGTMEGSVIDNLHTNGPDVSKFSHEQLLRYIRDLDDATRTVNHFSFEQANNLHINQKLNLLTSQEMQEALQRMLAGK